MCYLSLLANIVRTSCRRIIGPGPGQMTMTEVVKLLMGPAFEYRWGDDDRLVAKYGVDSIIGFYFHIVRFNDAYSGLDPWNKCPINEQIEYLMDYYPWLHNLGKGTWLYYAISDLGKVKNCKSTFEELDRSLRNTFGDSAHMCWAVSRAGLITSWSSKVSGFLSNTDLGAYINNVERGIVYVIKTRSNARGTIGDLRNSLIDDLLYDSYVDCIPPKSVLEPQGHPFQEGILRVVLPDDFCRKSLDDRLRFFVGIDRRWGVNLGEGNSLYLAAEYHKKNDPGEGGSLPSGKYSFTEAELAMFCQVNSDHCRHIVFNSHLVIDGEHRKHTLFEMIRNTYNSNKDGVISA